MPQVASIDYPNKRIYLAFDTVSNGFNSVEAYKEIRELRRTREADRQFRPLIAAQGNEPKGGGTFTPRRAVLLEGARFVPFDTSHTLSLLTETITDDGQAGTAVFDRSPLTPGVTVDIDVEYQQVEIITVAAGSGLDSTQSNQLANLHAMLASPGILSAAALANVPGQFTAAASNLLARVHRILGLESGTPLVVTDQGRTAGDIAQTITDDGTTTTVTVDE